ncbi:alpha/beta fold hydrolase [Gordonia hongkongensis]|uniref:alpha/beta fold hydrolase n=1 Tax=Gordonia hongkongensis TaxID=1701090 RepID=UPI003BF79C99
MTHRRLFFIHGAGGYADDGPLAEALAAALDATLDMPRFSDDDMSIEAWARPIRRRLVGLDADDHVVAHSFGATVLMHVFADADVVSRSAVLLAMPNWGPDGWMFRSTCSPAPALCSLRSTTASTTTWCPSSTWT